MLPWGTDQTFAERTSFDVGGGRLFWLCVHEPACRERYRAALALVRTRVEGLDLEGRATAVAAALEPWQALDPRRDQSLLDIANAVADTKAFLAERPLDVERWLASELPVTPPVPPAPGAPPPDAPSPPAGTAAGTTSASRAPSLRVGATRVGRTSLTTTVRVPRAGRVTQRASVGTGARTASLCTARVSAPAAGSVVVRCRLGRTAQRLRAAGTLRARITTRFTPVDRHPGVGHAPARRPPEPRSSTGRIAPMSRSVPLLSSSPSRRPWR